MDNRISGYMPIPAAWLKDFSIMEKEQIIKMAEGLQNSNAVIDTLLIIPSVTETSKPLI